MNHRAELRTLAQELGLAADALDFAGADAAASNAYQAAVEARAAADAPLTVYVVVLYGGSAGDEIEVYETREEAEASALQYAQNLAPEANLRTLAEAEAHWEANDLTGSFDSRWEIQEKTLREPRAPARGRRREGETL